MTNGSDASSSAAGSAANSDPSSGPQAVLIVDGHRTNFSDNPAPDFPSFGAFAASGGIYVVSVPKDAHDVSLEVSDHGRAQTISLSNGTRGTDAIATYYRKVRGNDLGRPQSGKRPLGADPNGAALGYSAYVENADLAAWTPDAGWAGHGYAWLIVQYESWTTIKSPIAQNDLQWAKSFSVTVNGTKIEADPTLSSAGFGEGNEVSVNAVYFKVPESITKATFSTHPYYLYADAEWDASIPVQLPTAPPIKLDFGSAAPAK